MINTRRCTLFLLLITTALIIPYRSAYAYLDPGTGSYVIQVIIAALLGALLGARIFWSKILNAVRRLLAPSKKDKAASKPPMENT